MFQQSICKSYRRRKMFKSCATLDFRTILLLLLTLSRQIQRPTVCLLTIKHLQRVLAFVIFSGVKHLNPNLLHTAAGTRPLLLVNSLLSVIDKHQLTRYTGIIHV